MVTLNSRANETDSCGVQLSVGENNVSKQRAHSAKVRKDSGQRQHGIITRAFRIGAYDSYIRKV